MSLDELTAILSPPTRPRHGDSPRDWEAVEEELGLQLPEDYKQFVDLYGVGVVEDDTTEIRIKSPRDKSGYDQLLDIGRARAESVLETEDPEERPYSVHPQIPGLLPIATDVNGYTLFLFTRGEPEEWPVTILSESGDFEEHPGPFTAFLLGVLTHRISTYAYCDPFFSDPSKIVFVSRG